ncbi:MAG: ABC transporter ATP-binding protein [Alphaproteobacteria bacterium]|nr:ABC transporter ATP-binding protein [Alphaproteobacteria bacterium]
MIVLMLFGMLLEMLGVGLVVPVIILLVQSDPSVFLPIGFFGIGEFLETVSREKLLVLSLILITAVYALKSSFLSFLSWKRSCFAFDLQAEFSERLFTTYINQPYNFHLQRNSAQLIRNASVELTIWTANVVMPTLQLLTEVMVVFGLCLLLLAVEPVGVVLVVTVLTILIGIFYYVLRQRISAWGKQRQYHEGMRIQHLQQSLGSIKEVKLMGREDDFRVQFAADVFASARAGQKQAAFLQIPGLWLEFFGVLGLAMLVATLLSLGKSTEVILPILGLFAAASFRLMPSANRILASLQSLRFGLPVAEVLYQELCLEADTKPVQSDGRQLDFSDRVELRNLSFRYDGTDNRALSDISLTISQGESVGFVGPSGSGKSTLIDLLLGLIEPQAGTILVDGRDIRGCLRGWQSLVGYVPQTIYLTDDSLRRNIALGIPESDISYNAVQAAVEAAQLGDWVSSLPQGLDTIVGERGVRLSGGQRQRVGIARALYHDPEVLVFDEATSSLDNSTEKEVMASVAALKGKKTLIMIAHRTSTLTQCDRLYRLDHGRITQTLAPRDLLQHEEMSGLSV